MLGGVGAGRCDNSPSYSIWTLMNYRSDPFRSVVFAVAMESPQNVTANRSIRNQDSGRCGEDTTCANKKRKDRDECHEAKQRHDSKLQCSPAFRDRHKSTFSYGECAQRQGDNRKED